MENKQEQTKEEVAKEQSIKLRLSTNLENTYKEEEKEKLWLCIKEIQDMAWQFHDEGSFHIFKKIFCHDKDIDKIFNKVKGKIRDSLLILNINKKVLYFLGDVIINRGEGEVSAKYSIIEKDLGQRFNDYQIAGRLKRAEEKSNGNNNKTI